MTKTSTASPLTALTSDQALILLDEIRTAQAQLLTVIEDGLRALGLDPYTTEVLHPRNEEFLELADFEADVNEMLAERFGEG